MQDTLARKLRVLRAERGLTIREAERLTGVDKDTLSKLERGVRRPYDVTLSRLARGYDVPVEELLEEPVSTGKADPPTGVGAKELDELLIDLGTETRHLGDPYLIERLSESTNAGVKRIRDEVRKELEALLPKLSRLGEVLGPDDASYMRFSKAREGASQQVFKLKMFFLAFDKPEPQEGDALLDRMERDSAEIFEIEVDR